MLGEYCQIGTIPSNLSIGGKNDSIIMGGGDQNKRTRSKQKDLQNLGSLVTLGDINKQNE